MRSEGLRLLALLAALLLAGCADFTRGQPTGDGTDPLPPPGGDGGELTDGPSFGDEVHGPLLASCQSCHGPGGSASTTGYVLGGEVSDDYATSLRFVNEAEPERSRLLTKAAGTGHAAGAVWPSGSAEHSLLLRWISEGAQP